MQWLPYANETAFLPMQIDNNGTILTCNSNVDLRFKY